MTSEWILGNPSRNSEAAFPGYPPSWMGECIRFCPSSVREGHTNRYKTEQSKRAVFLYFLAFGCLALYHV
jgi:hypothetical protein